MPKTKNDSRPDDYTVRLCRVETWLRRAEAALVADDPDVAFVLYWIAFNAAYARDVSPKNPDTLTSIRRYFNDLLDVDHRNAVRDAIWNDCNDQIHSIVDIEYLYRPYWDHANAEPEAPVEWTDGFNSDKSLVRDALQSNQYDHIRTVLRIVFDRLYVFRNQLVHGGAQFESHYNRDSIFDGARIMASLVPVFLDLMRASHGMEWGRPFFRPALKGQGTPSMERRRRYRDEDDGWPPLDRHHTADSTPDPSETEDKSRPDPFQTRLRRARAWCERAEAERAKGDLSDLDVAFLSYWIAFNAAYAQDVPRKPADWKIFRDYLRTLTARDCGAIHQAISGTRLRPAVDALLVDKYLFLPFWDNAHDQSRSPDWKQELDQSALLAREYLCRRDTHETLTILFQRIYTLRNQVAHGGARWNSAYNRGTMKKVVLVLEALIPLFIAVMERNPTADWGAPHYRVYPIYWP